LPVPSPPDEPALDVYTWVTGRPLLRVADDQFGATEFNPCQGEATRFAPLVVGGECVPTLYAAETIDAVLMESVFHDVVAERADEDPPEVYLADLRAVRRSTIAPMRDLRLGRLDDDALDALGLQRTGVRVQRALQGDGASASSPGVDGCGAQPHGGTELIETDADTYTETVRWAEHAHHHGAADGHLLDGLIWHSRRAAQGVDTRDLAVVLFGDRVARGDLRISAAPVPLVAATGIDELDAVANRLGVTLVR
jgi:hypothetical protein